MKIYFSPIRADLDVVAFVSGEVLTINSAEIDLSDVAEGGAYWPEGPGAEYVIGPVRRQDGVLSLHLIAPYGPSAPEAAHVPQPVVVTGGAIPMPGTLT